MTGNLLALVLGLQGFAQLVRQDEGGLVLAIQIAAQLKRGMALSAVREDGDGRENVPDRKLAGGKDGAGRNRELAGATLAAPHLTLGQVVQFERAALGAEGFAVIGSETDGLELAVSLIVRQAHDLGQREGPGFGREEEVLGHVIISGDTTHRI